MSTSKPSHILLGAIALLALIMTISYAFSISDQLKEPGPFRGNKWLLGSGPYFKDSLMKPYHHLVSDFTLLELEPRLENLVIVEGYENSKKYLDYSIQNDTLYVSLAKPDSDTTLVAANGEYPILVSVGSSQLESITMNGPGRIEIPAKPYGSNPDGEQVYKPEDWERFVTKTNKLDLHLINGGSAKLFVEIDTLNIVIKNPLASANFSSSSSSFNGISRTITSGFTNQTYLKGNVKKVNILDPIGNVNINGTNLSTDTLIVRSSSDKDAEDFGSILAICNNYLEADLKHRLDIRYQGQPKIVKKERDYGRVINVNETSKN